MVLTDQLAHLPTSSTSPVIITLRKDLQHILSSYVDRGTFLSSRNATLSTATMHSSQRQTTHSIRGLSDAPSGTGPSTSSLYSTRSQTQYAERSRNPLRPRASTQAPAIGSAPEFIEHRRQIQQPQRSVAGDRPRHASGNEALPRAPVEDSTPMRSSGPRSTHFPYFPRLPSRIAAPGSFNPAAPLVPFSTAYASHRMPAMGSFNPAAPLVPFRAAIEYQRVLADVHARLNSTSSNASGAGRVPCCFP